MVALVGKKKKQTKKAHLVSKNGREDEKMV